MRKSVYRIINAKQFIFLFFAIVISAVMIFGIDIIYSKAKSESKKSSLPVIIIDAGHGGEDGGTQSSSGILEKDINLSISLKLKAVLESLGFETIAVRESDCLIYDSGCTAMREKKVSDIRNRLSLMTKYPSGIFLSIHQNHFQQSKYHGAQVFYSKNHPQSKTLAEFIQNSVVEKLQNENTRKIKPSGTEIFLLHHATTPAVMVECGFLSNSGEALLLSDEQHQKKMAVAIADGVIKYLSSVGIGSLN